MKVKNDAFTLVELTISILIMSIVIIWISISLMKISDNFSDSTLKTDIFEQIKEFNYDTYNFNFDSWSIFTGWLLLYNQKNWVLIWSFIDEFWWFDYKLNYEDTVYKKYYFWFFLLNQNTLSWVLNDTINIYDLKFNNWKIYNKLIIKDFFINTYNSWNLKEININLFKKYNENLTWKLKQDIFVKKEDYLKFNFDF